MSNSEWHNDQASGETALRKLEEEKNIKIERLTDELKRYKIINAMQGKLLAELPPSADELNMAKMDAAVARAELAAAKERIADLEKHLAESEKSDKETVEMYRRCRDSREVLSDLYRKCQESRDALSARLKELENG